MRMPDSPNNLRASDRCAAGWLLAALLSVTSALLPIEGRAYGGLGNYQLTQDEVALLPEFCRHTQLIIERHGSSVAQREWIERVGPDFLAMHHYCIAVISYIRSHRHTNSANDRSGYLGFAEDNQSYVINHAKPGFAMLPDVYYRRGQVRVRLGRTAEAIKDLEQALTLNPKHARAAFELAQVFSGKGDRARAEQVLQAGLAQNPESRLLKTALADLQNSAKKR